MRELDELFVSLAKSPFRKKFHLQGKDLDYLHNKGLSTVLSHADDFIAKRLAPARISRSYPPPYPVVRGPGLPPPTTAPSFPA